MSFSMLAGKVFLSCSFSACCRFACDWREQGQGSDGPCLFFLWFKKSTERVHIESLLFLLTPFFHWNSPLLISSSTVEFLLVYWSQIPSAFEALYIQKKRKWKEKAQTNMPSKPVQTQDLPVSERTVLFPLGFLAGNSTSYFLCHMNWFRIAACTANTKAKSAQTAVRTERSSQPEWSKNQCCVRFNQKSAYPGLASDTRLAAGTWEVSDEGRDWSSPWDSTPRLSWAVI